MARPDKTAGVAELVESFQESAGAVLTEYRGLTVKQLQELRRSLGDNADYAVVKNTLTKIAATEAGVAGVDDLLTGPTAIAFINGDVVEAAKGLRDFARANPALVIKGGVLEGKPLDASEIARLADLESREVLLGRLAGGMLASLSQAVYLLNAPIAQVARLAGALQAKAEEDPSVLGGGAGEPAAPDDTPPTADTPATGETAEGTSDASAAVATPDDTADAGTDVSTDEEPAGAVSAEAVSTEVVSTEEPADAVSTEVVSSEEPADAVSTEVVSSEEPADAVSTEVVSSEEPADAVSTEVVSSEEPADAVSTDAGPTDAGSTTEA